jgi:serine protease
MPSPRLLAVLLAALALALPAGAEAHVRFHGPLAHAAGYVPNDPGRGATAGNWQRVQWNFAGPFGVNAPDAWQNLIAAGRPGGKGVTVAVLDTGVAYARRGTFRKSPDLNASSFVRGYDFIDDDPYPDDSEGHGTHVASTIVEATGNGIDLTGLAYGARVMPVRVLDTHGEGDSATIARGVRFAVDHGAKIINMSLEFSTDVVASDIPALISAIRYAHDRGALVVGASGNESDTSIAYPARTPDVLAVGATTEHGCLSEFSNSGSGLDIVAPGGGADAAIGDPGCDPDGDAGHDIYQVTYTRFGSRTFAMPGGYEGTSMAVPHVSATAALIVASGVLGPNPTPDQIRDRLEATARDLGPAGYDKRYGWGLVDAAKATTPGGPLVPPRTPPAPVTPPPAPTASAR